MTELVSYNRPLTRSARRALKPYGIESVEDPNEFNRWTVVTVSEEPPEEILERHELRVERDPERVYATHNGERVEVYQDSVTVDGREVSMDPEGAIEHAESEGWERDDD